MTPPRPLALLALVAALLASACATPSEPDQVVEPIAPTPPPMTLTPVRFDAYVLALRNIRATHPTLVDAGGSPTAVRESMREAVARAGLTLEEFRDLHMQVQADPVLKAEAEHRAAVIPPLSGATPTPPPRP